MKTTRKMTLSVFATILLVFAAATSAFALEIIPYADSVFDSATISLSTTKTATFSAITYEIASSISVKSVKLEKMVNNVWMDAGTLTAPSKVAANTIGYTASMSYSSNIGTGTYRIKATFNADGYEVTRYSNSRAY